MTCLTVIKLVDKFELDINCPIVKISEEAESQFGTTAELEAKEVFSIWELLHALMLPSGNDAAIALSEYFG